MTTHVILDKDIDPLKLVGNARLALHHHMAPATSDTEPDTTGDGSTEAPDVDPLKLVGNARLALHHHMAPATEVPEVGDSRS